MCFTIVNAAQANTKLCHASMRGSHLSQIKSLGSIQVCKPQAAQILFLQLLICVHVTKGWWCWITIWVHDDLNDKEYFEQLVKINDRVTQHYSYKKDFKVTCEKIALFTKSMLYTLF